MEQKKFKRTTVTAALPYANGGVHIGHLAGVYVPADIYVRYLRLKHEDVIFIGGSDEHGVPITIRAKKEGITPQDVVDRYHTMIKKSFEEFGISFDIYSRTTSETHNKMASDFFKKLHCISGSIRRRHCRRCIKGEKSGIHSPAPELGKVHLGMRFIRREIP